VNKELEIYTACPLCGSGDFDLHMKASCAHHALYKPALSAEMAWMKCGDCGHVFRDGYYTPEACAIVFADTHANQRVGHDMERQRIVSARMVEKVAAHRNAGAWLDVGFGNGSLLMTAQEFGFEPVGIDLRQENVEAIGRLGIRAYCCEFSAMSPAQKGGFDVISMADVLEHMADPKRALRTAHAMLKWGGVLFCSMPNSEAPIWQVLNAAKANPYWQELEHCHNFSRSRLYSLLEECGFSQMSYGISERYRACMEVIAVKK
jgi:protein O-GlcNAc transferase